MSKVEAILDLEDSATDVKLKINVDETKFSLCGDK